VSTIGPLLAFGDAVANTVGDAIIASRQTSAAPAAGLGAGLLLLVQDDAGGFQDAARIAGVLRNVTPATADGELQFFTRTAGAALSERYRIDGTGNLTMRGDFDFTAATDNQGDLGTATLRWATVTANAHRVFAVAGDPNPTAKISSSTLSLGKDTADALSWTLTVGTVSGRADMGSGNLLASIGAAAFKNYNAVGEANERMALAPSTLSFGAGAAAVVDLSIGRGLVSGVAHWQMSGGNVLDAIGAGSFDVRGAVAHVNAQASLNATSLRFGAGGATAPDVRVARTLAQELTIDDNNAGAADINVVPVADGNGNIGTAAKRWKLVRAVTITSGDLGFDDAGCALCGRGFAVSEDLVLRVVAIEPDVHGSMTRTVPVHQHCAARGRA